MFQTKATISRLTIYPLLILGCCLFIFSCSTVKDFPAQPFVYQTNIELKGEFTTDERKELLAGLENQLHDSVRVRRVRKLLLWNTLLNPPVYDSLNADKSVIYMQALLNAAGYYRDSIPYDTTLKIVDDKPYNQQRTTVNFHVYPGKLIRLDSIAFNFSNDTLLNFSQATKDTLQKITQDAMSQTLLVKGAPFSKALISTEIDRLTDVYRNNGYLLFSREELLAVWDTVGIALLRPTLDPIEQAQQLAELQRRRQNPTSDLEIRLRANPDTSHLIRYYVGNVTVYPDITPDTIDYVPQTTYVNDYKVVAYHNIYKPKIAVENIYLNRGDLYSQRNYLRTLNKYNSVGSWRLVAIDQIPREGTDTVDFVIRLTPAEKYSLNTNIEGSQNFGSNLFNGNFIGFNIGLQNRNFARAANLATSNFRFATEILSDEFVRAKQVSFTNAIYFPRFIPRLGFVPQHWKDISKTIFNFNASYTSRKDFFNLSSVTGAWGYDFNWKNKLLNIRIPNLEYAYLRKGDSLINLIENNRTYEYIFNSGLVVSSVANLTVTGGKNDVANVARFNLESSGLLTGLINSSDLYEKLHRFVKLDAEFRQNYKIRRSAFAWRIFAGAGYQLSSDRFVYNQTLPFFKSYFAGGANSMRAWGLRKLGPGSVVDSFDRNKAPERFGDMQLELNAEYRFFITSIGGIEINSALFTDIGNIWTIRQLPGFENGQFKFNKIWNDLAIGAGTGLRIDFGFFLIRLDWAYKLKDPSPDERDAHLQNKFFPYKSIGSGQLQLGVTYPF